MEKTYQDGVIDGVALFGRVCAKTGNCENCPVGAIRGAGTTCQDYARNFPKKMVSLLTEMDKEDYTYYNEFSVRFPESNLPVELLALSTCRKAVFEGYLDCPNAGEDSACIACWQEQYVSDVTEG